MSKVCIRCGNKYKRLDKHLQNKKICPVKYLDIDRDEILNNYSVLFHKYIQVEQERKKYTNCNVCNKKISKTNISKHMKRMHTSVNNIQNTQNANTIINGDQINNNNTININLTINNFGDEKNIEPKIAYEIFYIATKNPENMDIIALTKYIEELHMKIEENRNIYQESKSKYVRIYEDNKWKSTNKNDMKERLVKNTYKHMGQNIIDLDIANKHKKITTNQNGTKIITDIKDALKTAENISKFIKLMIDNKDGAYKEEWNEILDNIDFIMENYNKELKEIYKLTQ